MIETALETTPQAVAAFEHELAPNVRLRQTQSDGQFVEIVMPPFEINDLLDGCIADFPDYVIRLCQTLEQRDQTRLTPSTVFTPETMKGLLNTQILGTALARHPIRPEDTLSRLPELKLAFGLAMKGRLRLTADPVPEL